MAYINYSEDDVGFDIEVEAENPAIAAYWWSAIYQVVTDTESEVEA
ncbi:hypothetical protein [Halalkalicoccus sp. NIPERK01]|nr:hypothetical protein [Halalkalicoccus sp. NIPERK01]MDL5361316.1 hypothetical protein [Halalkalicoccus sp. NIPERK01]